MQSGASKLRLVESKHVNEEGWLDLGKLEEIKVDRDLHTERHQLRPYDVLVTARASTIKVALVPPRVSRIVAGATLLVVRPYDPASGIGHYLWYFLTSSFGSAELETKVRTHRTMKSLLARDLASIRLPVPALPEEFDRVKRLVEASEEAFATAKKVTCLRRMRIRDSVIGEIVARDGHQS